MLRLPMSDRSTRISLQNLALRAALTNMQRRRVATRRSHWRRDRTNPAGRMRRCPRYGVKSSSEAALFHAAKMYKAIASAPGEVVPGA